MGCGRCEAGAALSQRASWGDGWAGPLQVERWSLTPSFQLGRTSDPRPMESVRIHFWIGFKTVRFEVAITDAWTRTVSVTMRGIVTQLKMKGRSRSVSTTDTNRDSHEVR